MKDILFLAHRIPYPPDRGDKIRSLHLLKHLTGLAKVHLACFADDANYLAHAMSFANRHTEALEVFDAIGPYATRVPWSYCGQAEDLFLRHRAWAYSPPRRRHR